jgi:NADH-quinone oxidoreductase subunit G
MAVITIDGRSYEVQEGQNLLQASLALGFDLPYFCWHPAMGSVGACRQCAVKQFRDEKDTRGVIVMACMTPVRDGLRISISDAEAVRFRAGVIEVLMLNHPHDCPVCDEGGECHLQDMTVMTGHFRRHYRFKKRTYRNQYLGPLINHEMNRCIQCYRCLRFYHDYAGGRDFDVFGINNRIYFGRYEDGVLESPFSGNLVEICPTGVFTDKTLKRHHTRKWDLQSAPSVCVHCAVGCNTLAQARYGALRRIRNRYNHDVNGHFLCDRGRFGYEFVHHERRLQQPFSRTDRKAAVQPLPPQAAIARAAEMLQASRGVVGIGSARAFLEDNFALRQLVGAEHFYLGLSREDQRRTNVALDILRYGPAASPSLREAGTADTAVLLGEDPTRTAPLLSLALRRLGYHEAVRAALKMKTPGWLDAVIGEIAALRTCCLYVLTPAATDLDAEALRCCRDAPANLARLGFAVAQRLGAALSGSVELPLEQQSLADEIAEALKASRRPVVVCGMSGGTALIQAAANIAWALCAQGKPAKLRFMMAECNTLGLTLMGGNSLAAAHNALRGGRADTLIVMQNDLYRRAPARMVDDLLQAARQVLVLDCIANATTAAADIVLPTATYAEMTGTLVNQEGRAQRSYPPLSTDQTELCSAWRWMRDIGQAAGRRAALDWPDLDRLTADMIRTLPVFASMDAMVPDSGLRILNQKIPRQSNRFSGRTAMPPPESMREPEPPADPDSPLSFTMEGYGEYAPAPLLPRYWTPGWNSVQALHKFQEEIDGPLRGGETGRRLIEPDARVDIAYFKEPPPAFTPVTDRWLLITLPCLMGCDELSVLAPGIAELSLAPFVALSPADAQHLGVAAGESVHIELEAGRLQLPVRITSGLSKQVAGLPVGLPQLPYLPMPAVGRLTRAHKGPYEPGPSGIWKGEGGYA